MPVVNRFTQPIQPLVFNPISVEQFAMIPLAKAEAKAAGIRAASSLDIDYNVDIKDQKVVAEMTGNIDKSKDVIINRIMTEGVTDNLLTEFIALKKTYNTTKDKVRAAEVNKTRVDKWKDQVLRLHQNDPRYIEYIYGKEYGTKWQGTFMDDGTTTQFDAKFGPKSFDIPDDAKKALSGISMTLTKDIAGGGRFKIEKDPNSGIMHTVYVNTTGRQEFSNENKIVARMNAYLKDYQDVRTERGAYIDYRKIKISEVEDIFNSVALSMIKEDVRGGQVRKQFITPPTTDKVEPTTITPSAPLRTNVPQLLSKIMEGEELDFNPTIRAGFQVALPTSGIIAGLIAAPVTSLLFALPSGKEGDTFFGETIVKTLSKMYGQAAETFKINTENVKEIQATSGAEIISNILVSKGREEAIQNVVPGYRLNIAINGDEDLLRKEAVNVKNKINAGADPEEAYAEFYSKHLAPYIEDNVATTIAEFEYLTSESLVNKKLGLKNDPPGEIKDLAQEMKTGEGISRPIMNLGTRRVNTSDMIDKIQQGLANADLAASSYKDGMYRISKSGNGGSHPDTYKKADGTFVEDIAYGGIYVIEEKDGEEFKTVGTYLIGPSRVVLNNTNYPGLQNKMRALANIGIEGSRGITFHSAEGSYVGTIGRSAISVNASLNGRYGTASPGSLTFILPGTEGQYQFTQDQIDNMDITYSDKDIQAQKEAKNTGYKYPINF